MQEMQEERNASLVSRRGSGSRPSTCWGELWCPYFDVLVECQALQVLTLPSVVGFSRCQVSLGGGWLGGIWTSQARCNCRFPPVQPPPPSRASPFFCLKEALQVNTRHWQTSNQVSLTHHFPKVILKDKASHFCPLTSTQIIIPQLRGYSEQSWKPIPERFLQE